MKNKIDFTYMGHIHNAIFHRDGLDELHTHKLFEQFKQLANVNCNALPVFFIIDYSTRQYLFFTESIKGLMGYDVRDPMENGLDFMFHISHKHYIKALNTELFPSVMNFLQKTPQPDHKNYVFYHNSKMLNKNKHWVDILQRSTYVTSPATGVPLYCLGMAVDISHFKRSNALVQTIEHVDQNNGIRSTVERNYFYPYAEDALLTKRETTIVKLLADGLSSKMVAQKLHIAENTVANHRKNLLIKTNTKNIAQLIAYAAKNHII